MSQHTKEQILAGRQAVDAYRQAHSGIHQKPWHKGISEEHTHILNELSGKLADLGFGSLEEFFEANKALNIQIIRECYREEGFCDGCARFGGERKCTEASWNTRALPPTAEHPYKHLPMPLSDYPEAALYWLDKIGDAPCQSDERGGHRLIKVEEPDIDWRWH